MGLQKYLAELVGKLDGDGSAGEWTPVGGSLTTVGGAVGGLAVGGGAPTAAGNGSGLLGGSTAAAVPAMPTLSGVATATAAAAAGVEKARVTEDSIDDMFK